MARNFASSRPARAVRCAIPARAHSSHDVKNVTAKPARRYPESGGSCAGARTGRQCVRIVHSTGNAGRPAGTRRLASRLAMDARDTAASFPARRPRCATRASSPACPGARCLRVDGCCARTVAPDRAAAEPELQRRAAPAQARAPSMAGTAARAHGRVARNEHADRARHRHADRATEHAMGTKVVARCAAREPRLECGRPGNKNPARAPARSVRLGRAPWRTRCRNPSTLVPCRRLACKPRLAGPSRP